MLLLYSYTKRFTRWSHLVLGFALGIAPAAAWIAVRGSLDPRILILTAAVTFWVAGFDILYACQDFEFDRHAGLHSIPRHLGIPRALWIARAFHLIMLLLLVALLPAFALGKFAVAGVVAVALLLAYEHSLVSPRDLSKLNAAFFTMNGVISVVFAALRSRRPTPSKVEDIKNRRPHPLRWKRRFPHSLTMTEGVKISDLISDLINDLINDQTLTLIASSSCPTPAPHLSVRCKQFVKPVDQPSASIPFVTSIPHCETGSIKFPASSKTVRTLVHVGILFVALRSSLSSPTPRATPGELRLKITDPDGLALKTAVELVSQGNEYRHTFTTDDQGDLDAKRLPYGIYQLQIQPQGFAEVSEPVEIRSALPLDRTIRLKLAAASESVTVTAPAH